MTTPMIILMALVAVNIAISVVAIWRIEKRPLVVQGHVGGIVCKTLRTVKKASGGV